MKRKKKCLSLLCCQFNWTKGKLSVSEATIKNEAKKNPFSNELKMKFSFELWQNKWNPNETRAMEKEWVDFVSLPHPILLQFVFMFDECVGFFSCLVFFFFARTKFLLSVFMSFNSSHHFVTFRNFSIHFVHFCCLLETTNWWRQTKDQRREKNCYCRHGKINFETETNWQRKFMSATLEHFSFA